MEPDKSRYSEANTHCDRYEAAGSSSKTGRSLQRMALELQRESSRSSGSAAHGEDGTSDSHMQPPQHDRAG